MYVLIIAIHAVFIAISHLLGYRVFEGIFLIFGLFFLFYFSPLFFLDEKEKTRNTEQIFSFLGVFSQFSLKESLLIPITLLYIALYGFIFSIFGGYYSILSLHAVVVLGLYLLYVGYMFVFYWKHDIFFEIFRFHTLFTLLSTVVFTVSFFLGGGIFSLIHLVIGVIGLLAGTFLLSYTKKESKIFLSAYIAGLYSTVLMITLWLLPGATITIFLLIITLLSYTIFDIFPRNSIFVPYTEFFQYISLSTILGITLILFYITFRNIESIAITLLFLIALFFLTVHVRYTNYIVFTVSVFDIYFIYSLLFADLLHRPTIFSLFLFIFFLPLFVTGTTYFWEERHEYDYIILHYFSITFSIIYSVYIIFFLGWGSDLLFVISLCIFGVALLLFLSYFRFRLNKNNISH